MVRLFMQQDQRRRLRATEEFHFSIWPTHAIAPNTNRRSALAYWQRPTKTSHNSYQFARLFWRSYGKWTNGWLDGMAETGSDVRRLLLLPNECTMADFLRFVS